MTQLVDDPANLSAPVRDALDAAVADLTRHKDAWARLPVRQKVRYLRQMHGRVGRVAARWVAASAQAKGIPAESPLVSEEWLSGPWAVLHALDGLIASLEGIARTGAPPLPRGAVRTRPDGQVVVRVFPRTLWDRLLLSGVSGEVWLQPAVRPDRVQETRAGFYRRRAPPGRVVLVLGAGNIASIPPLDVLYKLIAEGEVCLLKMNPINAYLVPIMQAIFGALIRDGYVRIRTGDAAVGAYLCAQPGIDVIHITGSAATHDTIVYGPGAAGAERKRQRAPRLAKPISSELGNVSPTIVLPGPWSAADLRFQAEHCATQKMFNAGFNCIAAQVLVLPESWAGTPAFLDALRAVFRETAPRLSYYPGAADRCAAAVAAHPTAELFDPADGAAPRALIAGLDSQNSAEALFRSEIFGNVFAATRLPGADAAEFLQHAVRFCNERLAGTLGATILVHPATLRALGPAFEQALAELRYGSVGVNAWTGVGFLLSETSWGAYPGHTLEDVQSGIGVVHNAWLFDQPQKSVVRQPFFPFPRNLRHGEFHLLPKPPWFITHRQAASVARRLTTFEATRRLRHLPGLFLAALRG